ncbi:hypothetical protein SmJEL517_g02693 [Synchytrium microbalum]|uniref:Uncharacterized protein n=1 Tax=Synchytrium microbalum TaxID=1806994 RepID=A0A507C6H8_9FUNG|nr:uncharacterized protein SmJEL517_g02693 [Synchytrium microbalum]TPX34719.1 hypothetical protein SmJEL517_g02693 [Synchytrium microbalum]
MSSYRASYQRTPLLQDIPARRSSLLSSISSSSPRVLAIVLGSNPSQHQQPQVIYEQIQHPVSDDELKYKIYPDYIETVDVIHRRPWYKRPRCWILCCLLLLVILAIILPVLFLVIIPSIFQNIVNGASIRFDGAGIANATTKSFVLAANLTVLNTGPFDALISFGSNPVQISFSGQRIFDVILPDISAKGGSGQASIKQLVLIVNGTAFAAFAKRLVASETVQLDIYGRADVSALFLTSRGVEVKKTAVLDGMNGLLGAKLIDFGLPPTANISGSSVSSSVYIDNQSSFWVEIGVIYYELSLGNATFANGIANDITITQGINIINSTGVIDSSDGVPAVEKLQGLVNSYVSGDTITLSIKDVGDYNTPSWLRSSVVGIAFPFILPPTSTADVVRDVSFGKQASFQLAAATPYAAKVTIQQISSAMIFPLDVSFPFNTLQLGANVSYSGSPVGVLSTGVLPATGSVQSHLIQSSILGVLAVDSAGQTVFQSFLTDLVSAPSSSTVSISIQGTAGVGMVSSVGNLGLSGLAFKTSWSLNGFGGFEGSGIAGQATITGISTIGFRITVPFNVVNPATTTLSVGDLTFDVYDINAILIGTATISGASLTPGNNYVTASVILLPPPVSVSLIQNFITNIPTALMAKGRHGSTAIASLDAAISTLSFPTVLQAPGLSPILTSAKLGVVQLLPTIISVSVIVDNPFSFDLNVINLESNITSKDHNLGYLSSSQHWTIPGGSKGFQSPAFILNQDLLQSATAAIITLVSGFHLNATTVSHITVVIGTFDPFVLAISETIIASLEL